MISGAVRRRMSDNVRGLRWLCSSTGRGRGSDVYNESRKYGRPSTVTWSMRLHNSVSLIGTLKYAPKKYATRNARFGAFTSLALNNSPLSLSSSSSFWITLEMWDELAERAMLHLKPEDHIYVSGELGSYTIISEGVEKMRYKVIAKELNYVKIDEPDKSVADSRKETGNYKGGSSSQNYCNRLHLWQIMFASPDEWYDMRKHKKNPKQPDFKHKSTNEALWLKEDDPPWVHKQVELLDSKRLGPMNDSASSYSSFEWLSEEHSVDPNPTSSTNDWKVFK